MSCCGWGEPFRRSEQGTYDPRYIWHGFAHGFASCGFSTVLARAVPFRRTRRPAGGAGWEEGKEGSWLPCGVTHTTRVWEPLERAPRERLVR